MCVSPGACLFYIHLYVSIYIHTCPWKRGRAAGSEGGGGRTSCAYIRAYLSVCVSQVPGDVGGFTCIVTVLCIITFCLGFRCRSSVPRLFGGTRIVYLLLQQGYGNGNSNRYAAIPVAATGILLRQQVL